MTAFEWKPGEREALLEAQDRLVQWQEAGDLCGSPAADLKALNGLKIATGAMQLKLAPFVELLSSNQQVLLGRMQGWLHETRGELVMQDQLREGLKVLHAYLNMLSGTLADVSSSRGDHRGGYERIWVCFVADAWNLREMNVSGKSNSRFWRAIEAFQCDSGDDRHWRVPKVTESQFEGAVEFWRQRREQLAGAQSPP